MKAPEKIYIDDFGSELSFDWHTEHCYEKDIGYTRTDAFIEKAEKAMIEWAGTYISKTTGGGVKERKALANDLLSYFKNYIKE